MYKVDDCLKCGREMRIHPSLICPPCRRSRPADVRAAQAAAIKRDGGICRKCGVSGLKLYGHHVVPLSVDRTLGAVLENIVSLCAPCHSLEHPSISKFCSLTAAGAEKSKKARQRPA